MVKYHMPLIIKMAKIFKRFPEISSLIFQMNSKIVRVQRISKDFSISICIFIKKKNKQK